MPEHPEWFSVKTLTRLVCGCLLIFTVACAAEKGGGMASPNLAPAGSKLLTITKPSQASDHRGPVEVCLSIMGYTVEPAQNGVHEGKGHHHLLIDTPIPPDLTQPLPKDDNHIHLGDGAACKTLDLPAGVHTIRGLFARSNHIPYDPPVTDAIVILVN